MDGMFAASRQGGEQALRAIQLWGQFVALVSQLEAQEAGGIVYARANEFWANALTWEVEALDALALCLGKSRQQLLDEMAAAPPTSFS